MKKDETDNINTDRLNAARSPIVVAKAGQLFYKFCAKCKAHYIYEWKLCQRAYGPKAKTMFATKADKLVKGLCTTCSAMIKEAQ